MTLQLPLSRLLLVLLLLQLLVTLSLVQSPVLSNLHFPYATTVTNP